LSLPRALFNERLSITGDLAQLADFLGRHKTRADQSVRDELRDPGWELRLMIEPQVVELAVVRATSDELLALDEALRRAEQSPNTR
jgi:DNA-binding FadR family transcriptional regulator